MRLACGLRRLDTSLDCLELGYVMLLRHLLISSMYVQSGKSWNVTASLAPHDFFNVRAEQPELECHCFFGIFRPLNSTSRATGVDLTNSLASFRSLNSKSRVTVVRMSPILWHLSIYKGRVPSDCG